MTFPRRSKFNATKTVVDGITFHSKSEAKRYGELKMLEMCGKIAMLRLQIPYELAPSVVINGRKRPPLRYTADFCYSRDGNSVVEDRKGHRDTAYKIRRHLMKSVHGIEIYET